MYYEICVEYKTKEQKTLLLPFKYKSDIEMYKNIKQDFCKNYRTKSEDIARIEVFRRYYSKGWCCWKTVMDERY